MTWLLGGRGASSVFLVADTRVTLLEKCSPPKPHYLDVVQKVHHVRPNVLVGFAGSTRIGFEVVDALVRAAELPRLPVLYNFTADFLPSLIRRTFNAAQGDERELGCEVIAVGCHVAPEPGPRGLIGWQTVAKYSSGADFATEYPKPSNTFLSSGASPERLRQFSMNTDSLSGFATPDIAAQMCAFLLTSHLRDLPEDSVSDQFVLGTVTPYGSVIRPFVTYSKPDGEVVRHGPRAVVRTYSDLEKHVTEYQESLGEAGRSSLSLRSSLV